MVSRVFLRGVYYYTNSSAIAIGVAIGAFATFLWSIINRYANKPFLTGGSASLRLIDKKPLSSDTFRFRCSLPSSYNVFGLPVMKHVLFYGTNTRGVVLNEWNGKPDNTKEDSKIVRAYTPITGDETPGVVDFVIKLYRPDAASGFVDGGKMSTYLENIKINDTIAISGPVGRLEYVGGGSFIYMAKILQKKKCVNLVVGGSGITPPIRLMQSVINNKDDVSIRLIYANKSEDDILCRDLIEKLVNGSKGQIQLWYTVGTPPADKPWKYSTGFVTVEMLKTHLHPPSPDTLNYICGPPAMNDACKIAFQELEYDDKDCVFA